MNGFVAVVVLCTCVGCGEVHDQNDGGDGGNLVPSTTGAACRAADGGFLPTPPSCVDAGDGGDDFCTSWWESVGGSTLLVAGCTSGSCALRPSPPPCTIGTAGDNACAEYFQQVLGANAVADARCDSTGHCQTGTQCLFDPQTGVNDLCDCEGTVCAAGLICADKRCQPVCAP